MKTARITLCGSTKFKREFEAINKQLSLEGNVVYSVAFFGHADKIELTPEQKSTLDEVHKRKIDNSDVIFVVDVDDYIGESTGSEIEYARQTGKQINYLSQFPDLKWLCDSIIIDRSSPEKEQEHAIEVIKQFSPTPDAGYENSWIIRAMEAYSYDKSDQLKELQEENERLKNIALESELKYAEANGGLIIARERIKELEDSDAELRKFIGASREIFEEREKELESEVERLKESHEQEIQQWKDSLPHRALVTRNRELEEQLKEKTDVLKYAHNKAYILTKNKGAVRDGFKRDAEKLFNKLDKALESSPEQPEQKALEYPSKFQPNQFDDSSKWIEPESQKEPVSKQQEEEIFVKCPYCGYEHNVSTRKNS